MKKTTLLALACLLSAGAFPQISITQSDMPNVGDTIRVSVNNNIGFIDPETTDTNFVWDYTTLIPDSQRVESYVSCGSTAYPFFGFGSSYGTPNFNPDPIPFIIFGLTTSDNYNFFKESTAKYEQTGFGVTVSSIAAPIFYTSKDVIYNFPINYGDKDSSTSGYNISIPNTGYYGKTQVRKNTVDGWGTLMTPKGTYQVVRVRSTVTVTDTIHIDSLNFGIAFTRPDVIEFKYLAQGGKIPILQVNATSIFGITIVTGVVYQDSMLNNMIGQTSSVPTCAESKEGSLTASVSGGKKGYTYLWSDGQTTQTATGLSVGTYSVAVVDKYGSFLTFTDSVQRREMSESCLDIPNAFTPNGDGTNDTWVIRNLVDFTGCDVRVYDRWGSVVYSSKGYTAPWDGTYKGDLVPAETYYYIIDLGVPAVNKYSGTITIVR